MMQNRRWLWCLVSGFLLALSLSLPAAGQNSNRTVVQTCFGADRQPVPHTLVYASFAVQGELRRMIAVTDARGQVTWEDIPPVQVITWGEGVPAGVLGADVVTATEPLPAPIPGNSVRLNIVLTGMGEVSVRVLTAAKRERDTRPRMLDRTYTPNPNALMPIGAYIEARAGTACSVESIVYSTPPRMAMTEDLYIPPSESGQLLYKIPVSDATQFSGQMMLPDGTRPPAVSQLRVLPANVAGYSGLLTAETLQKAGFLQPRQEEGGRFTFLAPGAGDYTLLVDLYDQPVFAPQGISLQVHGDSIGVKVPLPSPVVTVPAGTDVYWLMRNAPANPQHLTVRARAKQMPVFAPREQLLAVWYQTTPDKLTVWTFNDPAPVKRELNLRAMAISLTKPSTSPTLLPLLPVPVDPTKSQEINAEALTESGATPLAGLRTNYFDAWSTEYLLADGNTLQRVTLPTVTPVDAKHAISLPTIGEGRTVSVKLPAPPAGDTARADRIGVSFDVPTLTPVTLDASDAGKEVQVQVPVHAIQMSLRWIGVGSISSADIRHERVSIPDWTPGSAISGTLIGIDARPTANALLAVGTQFGEGEYLFTRTDAEGRFAVTGIPTGMAHIMLVSPRDVEKTLAAGKDLTPGNWAGWTFTLPSSGLSDLRLTTVDLPAMVSMRFGNDTVKSSNYVAWWFSPDGSAVKLPAWRSACGTHDIPGDLGWLWVADGLHGLSRYQQAVMLIGNNYPFQGRNIPGPSLGIYFPLDLKAGLPGPVQLIGQGKRQGLEVTFTQPIWQASTLLNAVITQIDAVPPGDYTVIVDTPGGKVEAPVTIRKDGGSVNFTFPIAR